MLRQIAIGQMHLWELAFRLLIDAPPDDPHLRRVSESSTLSRNLVLLVSTMNSIVTRLAEGDQVLGAISACFT